MSDGNALPLSRKKMWPLVAAGLAWAALSAWLAFDGARPSGPSPLGDDHYRIQAWIILPTLALASLVYARVLWAGLNEPRPGFWVWAPTASGAYGTALGLGWVLPDIIAYAGWGFAGLQTIFIFCPLMSTAFAVYLGVRNTRPRSDRSNGALVARALMAWVLASIVLMSVVR